LWLDDNRTLTKVSPLLQAGFIAANMRLGLTFVNHCPLRQILR